MNKNYGLKLDLQFRCNNTKMTFDEFDENTSDFFIQINRQGEKVDISNSIPTLLVLKPSGVAVSQILEIKNNTIYGNLENSLKNEVGTYIAKLMLVEGDKKTFISNISYEVTENALLGKIDDDIVEDERYSVLLQLLERLSNIELQEQTRVDNENSRIEAENLREKSIEKIKNDIDFLVNETNKKVNDNLNSNTSKIDNLIIDAKEELNEYKSNKDKFINEDLEEFKENTNKSIQDYKTSKDIEIDNILNAYKTNTTNDINSFKNTVNSKIDKYKNDKDKAINEYIESKSLELGNYVEAKNNELDLYVSEKDILIDSKISEIDSVKTQMQDSVNNKLIEVDNAENQRQQEHEERQQFLNSFEGKLNTVVDDVAGIKDDVVSVKEANKRQDVFLQGLYNENLDGRVTVKEEGSVISLINSDNGLVDIVGLEGNTLVNYCTDGAKELTLNGDIDIEGTNVTLTEGVDNGLVDVALEGNTLVNLNKYIPKEKECVVPETRWYNQLSICELSQIKVNTDYTLIYDLEIIENNTTWVLGTNTRMAIGYGDVFDAVTGHPSINYMKNSEGVSTNVHTFPSKSSNKIVFNISDHKTTIPGKYFAIRPITYTQLLENQSIKYKVKNLILLEGDYTNKEIPPYFEGMKSVGECEGNKIEILSSNSDNTLLNKKEITLSEPLRALPNGVKDKIVKIGGKWFVERNCEQYVATETSSLAYNQGVPAQDKTLAFTINSTQNNLNYKQLAKSGVCDSFINSEAVENDIECIFFGKNINIRINKTKLISEDVEGFKNWLKLNPVTILYQVETPIYEEITDLTLNTYNDTTHISNNSTIPCNMIVKNTGYNTIIKPSTQYTVAFDTDTSGEVGINLGGAKVTATNNVTTITTPSTLVDDSLRLYGKGIKASKVRLLEGDKTNCIPSFFEGLQSSFEEQVEEDKYKIEILMNNKNLAKINSYSATVSEYSSGYVGVVKIIEKNIKVNPNLKYNLSFTNVGDTLPRYCTVLYSEVPYMGDNPDHNTLHKHCERNKGRRYAHITTTGGFGDTANNSQYLGKKLALKDIKLEPLTNSDYEDNKQNKIKLLINEPLRGVGDVKDRFVFKDNKLMIERSCSIRDYQEGDYELSNVLTDEVNTVYILDIPTYEEVPFELQKIILEGYENGTLFFDTNIPPTVTASYTANIPVVSKLNKVNETTEINTEDIAITQMAVDFLLMSALGEEMLNFKVKSGYNMASYFANRIIKGALKYEDVVNKYLQYKEDINLILVSEGHSDLIIEL